MKSTERFEGARKDGCSKNQKSGMSLQGTRKSRMGAQRYEIELPTRINIPRDILEVFNLLFYDLCITQRREERL